MCRVHCICAQEQTKRNNLRVLWQIVSQNLEPQIYIQYMKICTIHIHLQLPSEMFLGKLSSSKYFTLSYLFPVGNLECLSMCCP